MGNLLLSWVIIINLTVMLNNYAKTIQIYSFTLFDQFRQRIKRIDPAMAKLMVRKHFIRHSHTATSPRQ